MKNKSHCRLAHPAAVIDMGTLQSLVFAAVCVLAVVRPALAGDAPQWMHAVASVPLPAHDEKTDVHESSFSEALAMCLPTNSFWDDHIID